MLVRVHIVVHRPQLAERMIELLSPLGVSLTCGPTRGPFWDRVGDAGDLIIASRPALPEPIDETVAAIRNLPDHPELIVIWNKEDPEERARLLIAGCFAVLYSRLPDETMRQAILSFVIRRHDTGVDRIRRDVAETECRLADFESPNPAMKSFLNIVRRVIAPDSSLLILGETGVGKERLARAIHAESPRASHPFIPVSCAALPETLLDGELFGHVRGAFTGASRDRRGYFELAHGGTVFLDEIGELPKHLQVKLLRVLQERIIQRLGSESVFELDVRVMAATNRDLEAEIENGSFRRDLYYRLGVVTLEIPPLRKHREDIPRLLERYLQDFKARLGRPVSAFSDDAMNVLSDYEWPGNIRELINVVERAIILCRGHVLTIHDLPKMIVEKHDFARFVPGESVLTPDSLGDNEHGQLIDKPWKDVRDNYVRQLEREYLQLLLSATRGRLIDAADRGEISSRALYAMMDKHGFTKEQFRRR